MSTSIATNGTAGTLAADAGLLDRAMRRLGFLWRDMAAAVSWSEVKAEDDDLHAQMRACLEARGGEV
ncbi:MAG TPA: hypothetical protein VD970_14030, partial [Acetobacteraceae bacterium]|nr:hypothetical protein [Acetobacteraceae bacterium]